MNMGKFALVLFVFLIGFGWGAATMLIPTWNKMQEVVEFELESLELMKKIINGQKNTTDVLQLASDDCKKVMGATRNVLEGVDKLIEEIGNEI